MNIIEAIKSGHPFRRKNKSSLYMARSKDQDELGEIFTYLDLIANDWEIDNVKLTISKAALMTALSYEGKEELINSVWFTLTKISK